MSAKICFHCTLPVPKDLNLSVMIYGQEQLMCCRGCQAIAQTIVDSGLTAYYKHRDLTAINPSSQEDLIPESLQNEMIFYDHPEISKQFVVTNPDASLEAFLVIEGIVCAACVWLLERSIKGVKGVISFQINYSTHRAHLCFDETQVKLSDLLMRMHKLGYKAMPYDEHASQKLLKAQRQTLLKQFAVAAIFSMQVMMLAIGIYFGNYQGMSAETLNIMRWSNLVLSIPCITYASWGFYRSAYYDILNKRLSMDVNISLAIILGSLASIWNTWFNTGEIYFESVTMFAFLLLGSRLIELNARNSAMTLADKVLRIKPRFAHKILGDDLNSLDINELDDKETQIIALNHVNIGDFLQVKAGETIPTDGVLLSKYAQLDESLLTGESLPVRKRYADHIVGGALNIDQALNMRVTQVGAQTVFSQMVRLIDRAMIDKPKIAQLADVISNWFVSILLLVCIGSYIVWQMLDPTRAFEVALAILVVSCPCALALATPAALTAGSQILVGLGLLTTRSGGLENLARVTDIVFDKTGTLTSGDLNIAHILDKNGLDIIDKDHIDQLINITYNLEKTSNHPIAKAFVKLYHAPSQEQVKLSPKISLHNIEHLLGLGVQAQSGVDTYQLGKLAWFDFKIHTHLLTDYPTISTWIALVKNGEIQALFGLTDQLRSDARQTLNALKDKFKLHILSGDTPLALDYLLKQLEFNENDITVNSECLPEDKLKYVKALQENGRVVAMLGDGLNDAPVLAQADVSIAMNQGAQLAQTSADMILLADHLSPLLAGLETAKSTRRIIHQNLIWALVYNCIALPVAAMGFIVPWIAALGMSISSLIVIANTLRLRK